MIQDPQKPGGSVLDSMMREVAGEPELPTLNGIVDEARRATSDEATGGSFFGLHALNALKMFADTVTGMGVPDISPLGIATRQITGKSPAGLGLSAAGITPTDNIVDTADRWRRAGGAALSGNLGEAFDVARGAKGDTANKEADQYLSKKLGDSKVYSDTAGYLSTFVLGPGAGAGTLGGRGAAAIMSKVGQNQLARLAKKMPKEAVADLSKKLANGETNIWRELAKSPEWKAAASKRDKVMAFLGRHQVAEATAGNVAQSGLLADPETKAEEMAFAVMTPFFLPLARTGEWLGQKMATVGMSAETKKLITDEIIGGMMKGVPPRELLRRANNINDVPGVRRFVSEAISSTFESAAFQGFNHKTWEVFGKAMEGDPAAQTQLWGSIIGGAIGIMPGKMRTGAQDAPFFRRLGLDQTDLKSWVDADIAKRELEFDDARKKYLADDEERSRKHEADVVKAYDDSQKAIAKESYGKELAEKVKAAGNAALEARRVRIENKLEQDASQRDQSRASIDATESNLLFTIDALEAMRQERSARKDQQSIDESNRILAERQKQQKLLEQVQAAKKGVDKAIANRTMDRLEAMRSESDAKALALEPVSKDVRPLLRSGWEPVTAGNQTELGQNGVLWLRFGRDERIRVASRDGQMEVVLGPTASRLLSEAGHPIEASKKETVLTGDQARSAMEALTLYSTARRLQAANRFENLGFDNIGRGMWRDPETGLYHTAQIDGTTAVKRILDQEWDGRTSDMPRMPEDTPDVYQSEALDIVEAAFNAKRLNEPNPLVDVLLNQALLHAKKSNSQTGTGVRILLETLAKNAELQSMTRPGTDKMLAHELASVAVGDTTPKEAFDEMLRVAQNDQALLNDLAEVKRQMTDAETELADLSEVGMGDPPVVPKPPPGADPMQEAGDLPTMLRTKQGVPVADIDAPVVPEQPPGADPMQEARDLPTMLRTKLRQGQLLADMIDASINARRAEMDAARDTEFESSVGSMNPFAGPRMTKAQRERIATQEGSRSRFKLATEYYFEDFSKMLAKETGDPVFANRVRAMMSADRTLQGDLMPLIVKAETTMKAAKKQMQGMVQDETNPSWEYSPLRAAVEQDRAASPEVRAAAEAHRAVLERLWDALREAGAIRSTKGADGEMSFERLAPGGGEAMPRLQGKDHDTVFPSDTLRKALLLQALTHPANRNLTERFATNKDGSARTMDEIVTAVDEAIFRPTDELKELQFRGTEVESHAEHARAILRLPDVWHYGGKDYTLFDVDPFRNLQRAVHTQSARVAALREFGPDLPSDLPQSERVRLGIPDDKRGIQHATEDFVAKSIRGRGAQIEALGKRTLEWVRLAQGRSPELKPWQRAISKPVRYARAAETAMSWLYDLADPAIVLPTLAGFKRMAKAFGASASLLMRDRVAFMRHAEMAGALPRKMGELAIGEAVGVRNKLIDGVSWLNTQAERAKGTIYTITAETMVDSWKNNQGDLMDLRMLNDVLELPADVSANLVKGTATKAQEKQFIHEFVQALTGNKRAAEGSYAATNNSLNLLFDYQRFARSRAQLAFKVAKTLVKGWEDPKTRGAAIVKSLSTITGVTIGTQMSLALTSAFQSMTKQDSSLEQWWNRLWESPLDFAETWLHGLRRGLIGGPAESTLRVFEDPMNPAAIASTTRITKSLYALANAAQQPTDGDVLWTALKQAPIIPAGSHLEGIGNWARAMATSSYNSKADAASINYFKGKEGIPIHPPTEKDKPAEFYKALQSARRVIEQHVDDPKAAFDAAIEHIRQAIGAESKDSAIASILAMRHFDRMDQMEIDRYRTMRGDDVGLNRMYSWDQALSEIARLARSEPETAERKYGFDEELIAATNLAKAGSRDSFAQVYERVVEDATETFKSNGTLDPQVREFADAIATFPDSFEDIVGEKQAKRMRFMPPAYNSMKIQRIVRDRIKARAKPEKTK